MDQLIRGFRIINPLNQESSYKLKFTNHHVTINSGSDGSEVLCTDNNTHSIRSVYIELFSVNYNVEVWLGMRLRNEFDNEFYQSNNTPPDQSESKNEDRK